MNIVQFITNRAEKAKRDCQELKDRADSTSHPDDKADMCSRAAKLYAVVQELDYILLSLPKDSV